MVGKFMRSWWGDFSKEELEKFGLLTLIFGFIIGIYWYLRPLKDAIFMAVVGKDYIPKAKIVSLIVVLPLVLIYSKLVDMFPRQRMFYVLCAIYTVIALGFAYCFYNPTIGLANTVASSDRWLGWAWYVFVESFGTLIVALFWAFTGDTTSPETAAKGYPMIAFGGQVGNIFGPLLVNWILGYFAHVEMVGEGELSASAASQHAAVMTGVIILAAVIFQVISLLVYYFMSIIPKTQLVGYQAKSKAHSTKEPGFLEGLKIFVSSPYLLGVFCIITFYEVIITILDFNFKTFVGEAYPGHIATGKYLANYGTWVGIVSMLSVLVGINKIQKWMSLGASLALLPLIVAGAVLSFKTYPFLAVLFWIMVFSKAINYALNQPALKQLYIPISREAKYKSQAFVEMYGSRGSKAIGSGINNWRGFFVKKFGAAAGLSKFINYCTYASLAIIVVWLPITFYLGRTFKKAVDERREIC
jgi:AAA family ATP:ADP antiporter